MDFGARNTARAQTIEAAGPTGAKPRVVLALAGALLLLAACSPARPAEGDAAQQGASSRPPEGAAQTGEALPLIPAGATLERVRDLVKDPNRDPLPKDEKLAEQVKLGYRIFMNTPKYAPRYSGNDLSCTNCHLNGGQKERALPLVGVASLFPEYNKRAGRLISLEERVVGCFLRSMNGANAEAARDAGRHENAAAETAPSPRSPEVLALSAYIAWLSEDQPMGQKPSWRGLNSIAKEKRIPIDRLDPKMGKQLYEQKCAACHGADGQGVPLGPELKPAPLWGARSWNDGAGAARTYTLAGYIRYAMPLTAPGSLSDEEAQQIAAYITARERPVFPEKDQDYLVEQMPKDAVYYPKLYKENPLRAKLGE